MYIALSLLFILLVLCYLYAPLVHARLSKTLLKNKAVKSTAVVLTFDDGPGDGLTTELLKVLDEYKIRATFFLLGRNVKGREEIVRQIARQGHEICSHGYDHLRYRRISPFKALADINRGWAAINTALGTEKNKYPFRPPYGGLNFLSLIYLLACRVPVVYWSIDSGDTWQIMPDIERASRLVKKNGGGVCLIHDFERKVDKNREYVFDVTKSVINSAKANGMSLKTISELLAAEN